MKIQLDEYTIEFPATDLSKIDSPNMEGQATPEEVYIDDQLFKLRTKLTLYTYDYKILEK